MAQRLWIVLAVIVAISVLTYLSLNTSHLETPSASSPNASPSADNAEAPSVSASASAAARIPSPLPVASPTLPPRKPSPAPASSPRRAPSPPQAAASIRIDDEKLVSVMEEARQKEQTFLKETLGLKENEITELEDIHSQFQKRLLDSREQGQSSQDRMELFKEQNAEVQKLLGPDSFKKYQAYKREEAESLRKQAEGP